MAALNFRLIFAPAILDGRKTQTIRAIRKDGRVPKRGDTLQLYTGMRTRHCHKICDVICEYTREITITELGVKLDGQALYPSSIYWLAEADGFDSVESFKNFFKDTYGLPFRGTLIKWKTS